VFNFYTGNTVLSSQNIHEHKPISTASATGKNVLKIKS